MGPRRVVHGSDGPNGSGRVGSGRNRAGSGHDFGGLLAGRVGSGQHFGFCYFLHDIISWYLNLIMNLRITISRSDVDYILHWLPVRHIESNLNSASSKNHGDAPFNLKGRVAVRLFVGQSRVGSKSGRVKVSPR